MVCARSLSDILSGRVVVAASRWMQECLAARKRGGFNTQAPRRSWNGRQSVALRSALCVACAGSGAGLGSSSLARIHLHQAAKIHRGCLLSFVMSSWLPESHRLQLAVTALASGCIAASAVIGLQNAKRWYSVHDLKGSIPDLSSKHDVEKVRFQSLFYRETKPNSLPDQRLWRRRRG